LPFGLVITEGAALAIAIAVAACTVVRAAIAATKGTLAKAALRLALRLEAGDFRHRNAAADEVLDATHLVTLGVNGEGVGLAISAGTTRTANAVDVVFRLHRQVIVERVADSLDINAA